MSTRRGKRSRSTTATPARRKKVTPKRTGARAPHTKKKRSPKRSPKTAKKRSASAVKKKRSSAAKKGWAKRRKKARLIKAMTDSNWRDIALPTRDELYDHLQWMSEQFEIEISDMYRMYFGYEVGEAAE